MTATEQVPEHTVRIEGDKVILKVALPGVESAGELNFTQHPTSVHVHVLGRYKLDLLLGVQIANKPDYLKFVKKSSSLKAQFVITRQDASGATTAKRAGEGASAHEQLRQPPFRAHENWAAPATAQTGSMKAPAGPWHASSTASNGTQQGTAAAAPAQPQAGSHTSATRSMPAGGAGPPTGSSAAASIGSSKPHPKAADTSSAASTAHSSQASGDVNGTNSRHAGPHVHGHQSAPGRPAAADSNLYETAKELANREAAEQWLSKAAAAGRVGDMARAAQLLAKAASLCPARRDMLEAEFWRQVPDPPQAHQAGPTPVTAHGAPAAHTSRPGASAPSPKSASAAEPARPGSGSGPGPTSPPAASSSGHGSVPGLNSNGSSAGPTPAASHGSRSSQPYSSTKPQRESVRPDPPGASGSSAGRRADPSTAPPRHDAAAGSSQRHTSRQQHSDHQHGQGPAGGSKGTPPPPTSGAAHSAKPAEGPRASAGSHKEEQQARSQPDEEQAQEQRWDWLMTLLCQRITMSLKGFQGSRWASAALVVLSLLFMLVVVAPFYTISFFASVTSLMAGVVLPGRKWRKRMDAMAAKGLRQFRYTLLIAVPSMLLCCCVLYLLRGFVWDVFGGIYTVTSWLWLPLFWRPNLVAALLATGGLVVVTGSGFTYLAMAWPMPLMFYVAGVRWMNVLALVLYAVMYLLAGGPVRAAITSGSLVWTIGHLAWYQALPAVVVELLVWLVVSAAYSNTTGSSGASHDGGSQDSKGHGQSGPRAEDDEAEYDRSALMGGGVKLKSQKVPGATGDIAKVLAGKDHFEVLGLDWRQADSLTDKEVKDAKRNLLLKVHPDKAKGSPGADEAAKRVNAAAEKLETAELRKQEATALRQAEAGPARAAGVPGGSTPGAAGTPGFSHHAKLEVEIPCPQCSSFHTAPAANIDSARARYCADCKTYHAAKSGEGWIWEDPDAFFFPEKKMYVCLDGMVFDITELGRCADLFHDRSGASIRPNSHTAPFWFGTAPPGGKGKGGGGGSTKAHGGGNGYSDFKGKGTKGKKGKGRR